MWCSCLFCNYAIFAWLLVKPILLVSWYLRLRFFLCFMFMCILFSLMFMMLSLAVVTSISMFQSSATCSFIVISQHAWHSVLSLEFCQGTSTHIALMVFVTDSWCIMNTISLSVSFAKIVCEVWNVYFWLAWKCRSAKCLARPAVSKAWV